MKPDSSTETLQQAREHSLDLEQFSFGFAMFSCVQHVQVARQLQEVFQFAGRAHGNVEELAKLSPATAATTFGDICGNRARCSTNLTLDTKSLVGWQLAGHDVYPKHELMTPTPNLKLTKILHGEPSGTRSTEILVYFILNTYYLKLITAERPC